MADPEGVPGACNICGSALIERFEKVLDAQSGETFKILECSRCGLGHTSPQPKDLGSYYGAEYHGGRHGFTARYCIWRRLRFLASQAPANGRLLDVGCGDGSFLVAAREQGWQVSGTEMNPKLARERGLTIHEDLADAKAAGPYQCVTLWHSLEHFRDPRAAIELASAMLAPDGVMMIAVPDWSGMQANAFGAHWFHLDVPRHLFHFSAQSITTLASDCGLKIHKTWHTEAELDLFGWTQSALNVAMEKPNLLFSMVMGKPTTLSSAQKVVQLGLGSAATLAALPLFSTSVALGRGGIVVHALQRRLNWIS